MVEKDASLFSLLGEAAYSFSQMTSFNNKRVLLEEPDPSWQRVTWHQVNQGAWPPTSNSYNRVEFFPYTLTLCSLQAQALCVYVCVCVYVYFFDLEMRIHQSTMSKCNNGTLQLTHETRKRKEKERGERANK